MEGGDSGGGQQDVGHEGVATRGGALAFVHPPVTEISSIIHSVMYHKPCVLGTFYIISLKKAGLLFWRSAF